MKINFLSEHGKGKQVIHSVSGCSYSDASAQIARLEDSLLSSSSNWNEDYSSLQSRIDGTGAWLPGKSISIINRPLKARKTSVQLQPI